MQNLNRIIEKAVKKYTRDVKLNNFPKTKNFFKWNQNSENKLELKDLLINFYNNHKLKFILFFYLYYNNHFNIFF